MEPRAVAIYFGARSKDRTFQRALSGAIGVNLKYNVLANFVSKPYVIAVSIIMAPLFTKHMDAETYGLVGFL